MYCINPQDDEPIFLIDAQIGRDDEKPDDRYIDASDFVRELLYMDGEGKKRIQVWINSPGGSVDGGMNMYHAMLATKTKVDTRCIGMAASIAGVLFQAGRKREMMDFSNLMYHEAYSPGDKSGKKDKGLEVINKAIAVMISSRTWNDEAAVRTMMSRTTYINAQDAKDAGLCDEVIPSDSLNKPRMTNDIQANWKEANEYVNKILPSVKNQAPKIILMKDLAKILNLNPEASEAAFVAEVSKLQNKNSEFEKCENELKTARKALADAEEKYNALNKKMGEEEEDRKAKAKKTEEELKAKEESDKKNAELELKKVEAKKKILETVNSRKLELEDSVIEDYVNLAGGDEKNLASVIKTIEAIPVTKKAPVMTKIVNKDVKDLTGIPLVAVTGKMVSAGNGMPEAPEVGDTTEVVSAINAFNITAYKNKLKQA